MVWVHGPIDRIADFLVKVQVLPLQLGIDCKAALKIVPGINVLNW